MTTTQARKSHAEPGRYHAVYYRIGWREIVCDVHRGIGLVSIAAADAYADKVGKIIAAHECAAHHDQAAQS